MSTNHDQFRPEPPAAPEAAATRRLTICGLQELSGFCDASVTHVLSILDPSHPDPADFDAYAPHRRLTLRFDDVIEPMAGYAPPEPEHVEALLRFGEDLDREPGSPLEHLLVHCHMGISRSTAAMTILLAQAGPGRDEDGLFAEVTGIRPQAWPNSRMIAMADAMLGRDGRLLAALKRHYAGQIERRPTLAEMIRRVGRGAEVDMAA